jgi:hypothetical protein
LPELAEVATAALEEVVVVELAVDDGVMLDEVTSLETTEVVAGIVETIELDATGVEDELNAAALAALEDAMLETAELDATLEIKGVDDGLLEVAIPADVEREMLDMIGLGKGELLSTGVDRIELKTWVDATTLDKIFGVITAMDSLVMA